MIGMKCVKAAVRNYLLGVLGGFSSLGFYCLYKHYLGKPSAIREKSKLKIEFNNIFRVCPTECILDPPPPSPILSIVKVMKTISGMRDD